MMPREKRIYYNKKNEEKVIIHLHEKRESDSFCLLKEPNDRILEAINLILSIHYIFIYNILYIYIIYRWAASTFFRNRNTIFSLDIRSDSKIKSNTKKKWMKIYAALSFHKHTICIFFLSSWINKIKTNKWN